MLSSEISRSAFQDVNAFFILLSKMLCDDEQFLKNTQRCSKVVKSNTIARIFLNCTVGQFRHSNYKQ